MFETSLSRHIVPFDGQFDLKALATTPPEESPGKKEVKKRLKATVKEIAELQRRLYAGDHHSLLLVFQAMDAAGKDSTIRATTSGVNPAGFQVSSFKAPSSLELDHDFLWRSSLRLPERGRIGIFNRSYYEEVLVVRVHPEYLGGQRLPDQPSGEELWATRMESIRDHELHLARNGCVILKFFLNVSRDEQARRFLSRLEREEKYWKFSSGDLKERALWPKYMHAYEQALNATSRPWAPWLAIPADDKGYMRLVVAEAIRDTLEGLKLSWPQPNPKDVARHAEFRDQLNAELNAETDANGGK